MAPHFLIVCALFFGFFFAKTKQGEGERRLLATLFKDYAELERPVLNHQDTLEVQFALTLQQIIDVDERYQIIQTNMWLNLIWSDYRLRWEAREFANITVINVPIKLIWRPDVLMYNSVDEKYDTTYPTNAVISNDGKVTWIPPGLFKSSCNLDIKWFPFDDQQCELKFGSWAYDATRINLTLKHNTHSGDISAFIKNGEWSLLGMPAKRTINYYEGKDEPPSIDIAFIIKIRRRPLYYTFNLVVPSVLLVAIALLTFTLPVESGEKISLGVTILLSMTVFLLLLVDTLPPTSDAIPLIGWYFAGMMTLCSLSVLFTVLVLNFHSRRPETHAMPDWVKRGICHWLAWMLRMERPGHDLSRKALLMKNNLHLAERSSRSLIANVLDIDDDIRSIINTAFRPPASPGAPRKSGAKVAFAEIGDTSADPEMEEQDTYPKCKPIYYEAKSELAAILRELRTITNKMRESESNETQESDWQFAAMVIDRFNLYAFVISTFVTTFALFMSAPNIFSGSDDS